MKKNMKLILMAAAVLSVVFLLSGCMPGDGANSFSNPAGFFTGIWHGWLAPVSLVFSFINDKYAIYESFNTGFTYDLGYYMAIISGFGTLALSRKKKKSRSCDND